MHKENETNGQNLFEVCDKAQLNNMFFNLMHWPDIEDDNDILRHNAFLLIMGIINELVHKRDKEGEQFTVKTILDLLFDPSKILEMAYEQRQTLYEKERFSALFDNIIIARAFLIRPLMLLEKLYRKYPSGKKCYWAFDPDKTKSNGLNLLLVCNVDQLYDLVSSLIQNNDDGGAKDSYSCMSARILIYGLLSVLVELRDKGEKMLTVDLIKKYLGDVELIDRLARRTDISSIDHLRDALASFGWDITKPIDKQVSYFRQSYTKAIAYLLFPLNKIDLLGKKEFSDD